ncbi:MAG: hypothetical protein JNK47_16825 [Mesorhizobium sp.]|nr:hypothetical protein [Mesorhizobium sp.]MBL8578889.1 hypothetical protein [Mesorhizobium sp.]
MSAFLAVTYDDRVELLTDGAIYTADGTLTGIRRKVWPVGNLPIAITGRGNSGVLDAFVAVFRVAAGACATVDDALASMAGVIERRAGKGMPSDVEMVICAISESRGPSLFYFATADMWGAGIEPWTLVEVDSPFYGGPLVDVSDLSARDGLAEVGAEVFSRMRRTPGRNPLNPEMPKLYGIGGHVDHTTVSAAGCTIERIHEWPEDVVGRRIDGLGADKSFGSRFGARVVKSRR